MELKLELRGAVKTALYRIAVAYGDHLGEVQLPTPELRQRLDGYRQFLE